MKKQKKECLNFIIPLEVYPFDIMMSLAGSDSELKEELKYHQINYKNSGWKLEDIAVGRTIMFNSGQLLVRMHSVPNNPREFGFLQHEIFHVVQLLMKRIGIPLAFKSCEAYAYLIGFITEKVYEKLKI